MNWSTIEKINICIQRIKAGDQGDAIIELHKLMGNHLHFIAYKYFKNNIEEEDVIQDFWMDIRKYCNKCRYLKNGFNYLTKIFENNCKIQLRKSNAKQRNIVTNDISAFAEVLATDENTPFRQIALRLTFEKAMKLMTLDELTIFKYVCYSGKTVREIAEELHCSKSSVDRTRKTMMEKLEKVLIEDGWDKDGL